MSVSRCRPSQRGFSLLELLVVVGLIMLVAAVGLPNIAGYFRLYRIRTATRQVTEQLQQARTKAVMKNANLGVLWLTSSDGLSSTWVIEDDMQPKVGTAYTSYTSETLTTLLADRAQSPGWVALPSGIKFVSVATCPGGGAAPAAWGMRFGRLGAACAPSSTDTSCPLPGGLPTMASYVSLPASATADSALSVCLHDERTDLRRRVSVTLGGRILTQ